ncbi:uncharacterized protein TrAtP1_011813 [Trichoderma atroviride]|uniref:uncharacterized protein n=1 Tax=Hypocrea atroviridis TaxID=63577 RepID=UPI00331FC953|nr:hypothetical protein TrAtP1_011813 [Trichoderma atroviride]
MAQLQDEIKALLHVPEASHLNLEKESFFIPQDSLYQLLNEDKVTQVIDEIDEIPWHLKETTTVWIMKNGRRILAILSFLQLKRSYISKFMERDVFDEHLPLNENSLQAILPEPANSLFYDAQWQFSAPKLARDGVHRVFHPNHRLPFTINRWIDSGGFGDIYEIMIHPKHQNVPLLLSETDQSMVRKEFKPPRYKKHVANSDIQDDKEGFSNELRNLNILNELKHANIIQLLTSYTHNGRHNLIFPFVQDGNLEKLFKGDRPLQFDSDEKFLIALCGLSSAIQEVHYYTLQRLKIDLLGCHHDLKTKNILNHSMQEALVTI